MKIMRKFYMIMLVILCIAGTAMAGLLSSGMKSPEITNTEAEGGYADASIEGDWNFTLDGHYAGNYSLGTFTGAFTATLDGNTVTFASADSQYNIVAEFTAENTLTFNVAAVGAPATYTMTQNPYVDGTKVTDVGVDVEKFVFKSFSATYDPKEGTISFPEGVGLAYGYADSEGVFSYYEDAFDFVSASKASEYKVVGTYPVTIQPTDISGSKSQPSVDIEVEVRTSGGKYWMVEESKTNYFNDRVIPFSYNEDTKFATFTASYVGEFGGNPVWFSAFVFNGSITEPQETYGVPFDASTGFEFPGNSGLGWFVTSSAEIFDAQDLYSAFYVLPASSKGDFADASIEGDWDFTLNWHYAGEWSLGEVTDTYTATLDGNMVTFESQYGDKFVAEFTAENTLTFKIAAVGASATFTKSQNPFVDGTKVTDAGIDSENFVFESFTATYNPEAGTITFPEGTGLAYGYADSEGVFNYYEDAFDFISASKASGETGINKITVITGPVDVYSLDGRLVRKQTTTLDGLKGIYIVGGKKVVLK